MRENANTPGAREGPKTLPLNVLVKGRLCLLVGAGHVAHRKCATLVRHGARVVLVAPEVRASVLALEKTGQVEIRQGRYETEILDDLSPFLVYAATDDDELNRRIVKEAAERRILASSVSSWREGDFISPSVIPWGKGQVSVTTEGASCRQAKFMRIRLSELLGGERELFLLGVDLRSLTLSELERVRPSAERVIELTGMLRHLAALEEFALLATCNRLELYAWTRQDEGLLSAVLSVMGLTELRDRVYVATADDVVEHAANVVSGHYSQVACETQITGQFKAAFSLAFRESVAGVHLQNLHDRALRLGKRIRALHGRGEEGLPELVAGLVRRRIPERGNRVLVLGAGGLGREVAERLASLPEVELSWGNRTLGNLPAEPDCPRVDLESALGSLKSYDQVVTVLGADASVVRPEHLARVDRLLLVDLGLPRNVDPAIAGRDGIEILDLGHFRKSGTDRERLVALAHTVAEESGAIHG